METKLNLIKLKIKAKSLAEEARIIRKEERKIKDSRRIPHGYINSLNDHRKYIVRNEARATQLAIAYISGRDYLSIEKKCTDIGKLKVYIFPRVLAMVKKYGDYKITDRQIKDWMFYPEHK